MTGGRCESVRLGEGAPRRARRAEQHGPTRRVPAAPLPAREQQRTADDQHGGPDPSDRLGTVARLAQSNGAPGRREDRRRLAERRDPGEWRNAQCHEDAQVGGQRQEPADRGPPRGRRALAEQTAAGREPRPRRPAPPTPSPTGSRHTGTGRSGVSRPDRSRCTWRSSRPVARANRIALSAAARRASAPPDRAARDRPPRPLEPQEPDQQHDDPDRARHARAARRAAPPR